MKAREPPAEEADSPKWIKKRKRRQCNEKKREDEKSRSICSHFFLLRVWRWGGGGEAILPPEYLFSPSPSSTCFLVAETYF